MINWFNSISDLVTLEKVWQCLISWKCFPQQRIELQLGVVVEVVVEVGERQEGAMARLTRVWSPADLGGRERGREGL